MASKPFEVGVSVTVTEAEDGPLYKGTVVGIDHAARTMQVRVTSVEWWKHMYSRYAPFTRTRPPFPVGSIRTVKLPEEAPVTQTDKGAAVHAKLDAIEAARKARLAELNAMTPDELAAVELTQRGKPVSEWEVCFCCHTPLVRFACPLGCM